MTVTPVISSVCCLCECLRARDPPPLLLFQLHGRIYLPAPAPRATVLAPIGRFFKGTWEALEEDSPGLCQ